MKRRDLEAIMRDIAGASCPREGRHDVWSDGEREEAIPRHREINEQLALAILRHVRKEKR